MIEKRPSADINEERISPSEWSVCHKDEMSCMLLLISLPGRKSGPHLDSNGYASRMLFFFSPEAYI
jgi:hypothetical protein